MYIDRLDWDDYRVEHIARHDVEPHEVWEVCNDRSHLARRQGRNRYLVYKDAIATLFMGKPWMGGTYL